MSVFVYHPPEAKSHQVPITSVSEFQLTRGQWVQLPDYASGLKISDYSKHVLKKREQPRLRDFLSQCHTFSCLCLVKVNFLINNESFLKAVSLKLCCGFPRALRMTQRSWQSFITLLLGIKQLICKSTQGTQPIHKLGTACSAVSRENLSYLFLEWLVCIQQSDNRSRCLVCAEESTIC